MKKATSNKSLKKLVLTFLGLTVSIIVFAITSSVPSPPGRPTVIDIQADRCTIKYEAPLNDGGSSIIGYIIERREEWKDEWIRCNKQLCTSLRYTDTGLTGNMVVKYRVSAENKTGRSAPSRASDFVTIMDPYGR